MYSIEIGERYFSDMGGFRITLKSHLLLGANMKKDDAFGIGCVWFGDCCISDIRLGLADGTIT